MSKTYKIFFGQFLIFIFTVYVVTEPYLGSLLITRGNSAFLDNEFNVASANSAVKHKTIKKLPAVTPTSSPATTAKSAPIIPSPTPVASEAKAAPNPLPAAPAVVAQPTGLTDSFGQTYVLQEQGSMSESASPDWWLSSGGYFYSSEGAGKTIAGSLSILDPWRVAFSISNSLDTDGGYHPQNIFRLVTRSKWLSYSQETYFNISSMNNSASPNRNASNGLFFFNRYQNQNDLYYTGLRVDGYAVIKKKIAGTYYTMAYVRVLPGSYNRDTNPNLLPLNTWIGLKSVVKTNPDNTVSVEVYTDIGKTGNWTLGAKAIDDGKQFGAVIGKEGYAGVRTDFMDVRFDDFKISRF